MSKDAESQSMERQEESRDPYNIPKPLFQKSATLKSLKGKSTGAGRPSSRTSRQKGASRSITPRREWTTKESIGNRRRSGIETGNLREAPCSSDLDIREQIHSDAIEDKPG